MPSRIKTVNSNHGKFIIGIAVGLALSCTVALVFVSLQKETPLEVKEQTRVNAPTTPPVHVTPPQTNPIVIRDQRVDMDPLYPPLQRERIAPMDTYRPIAYLVAEEENGGRNDVWKLYARERSRGSTADFYAVSADRQFDAKVALTDENVRSQPRLRDIYNLPTQIQVRHPLFRSNMVYQVVEYDRADWGNLPNYY